MIKAFAIALSIALTSSVIGATITVSTQTAGPTYIGSTNEPLAEPQLIPQGIEVPYVVWVTQTNANGIAFVATDSGELVPFVAHESPYPDKATIEQRIKDALAKHKVKRDAQSASTNAFGKGQLQDRITAIEAWIKAQESK